jgi:hypothetical protein
MNRNNYIYQLKGKIRKKQLLKTSPTATKYPNQEYYYLKVVYGDLPIGIKVFKDRLTNKTI